MAFWHVGDSKQRSIVLEEALGRHLCSFSLDKSGRGDDMCPLFASASPGNSGWHQTTKSFDVTEVGWGSGAFVDQTSSSQCLRQALKISCSHLFRGKVLDPARPLIDPMPMAL